MSIPIHFTPARHIAGRPTVTFNAAPSQSSSTLLHCVDGRLLILGESDGGWVFCGLEENGCGEFLEVKGARVILLSGWSNDDCNVEFEIEHDGHSTQIDVRFNTRAD
jgi:hypothetical protein